ncbi:histidine kinase, partial [Kocuria sp. APC 4018]|nr:histidine kinase [Kocuria sp. APC 4018]
MSSERTPAGTFTTRMMVVLFAIVAGIVALCLAAVVVLTVERVYDQAEQEALGIARTLAVDPVVVSETAARAGATALDSAALAEGPVQRRGEAVRQSTGALFVVVTNDQGIRMSHPNPDSLG